MEVIVSHLNADFDAFASMVAAKRLYPDALLVFPGSQEKKVRDFMDFFRPVEITRVKDVDMEAVTKLIIVDAKTPGRIGPFAELIGRPGLAVHIYDHHPRSAEDIKGTVEVIEEAGATATIFAGILKERRLHPTAIEASILALGIYEETGNLLFSSTTERDLQAAAYLLKRGASLKIVSTYLRAELNPEELDLLNELMQTSKETLVAGVRVLVAAASRDDYAGEAAMLAHRIMDMTDADALILMLRLEEKILMVGRSRSPGLDVSEILGAFGGGGHRTAASATVREQTLELLEERLMQVIKEGVKPVRVASDIMTRPVITIEAASTVKKAETTMTRYGVNVLPVVRDGLFKGLISREAVEKALYHGFGASKVVAFMTSDAPFARLETPIREVESVMIERNQRFMPVLEDGRITGAITRTDLLRGIYEDFMRSGAGEAMPGKASVKDVSGLLKNRFPEEVFGVLELAGREAEALGFSAYLVGGSVRDLLRGRQNLDIDMVVEGDGIAFAKALGARLQGRVRCHERFQTAKIIKDSLRLDVATARTEYYESPAALPKVEVSSIKKDLYRRDFTINTLAVKLNPREFGKLVDFFGAQRDLKDKTIRVLHNLSFVEDPTRAFRAVRFAVRFGFKLSKHTEGLIKSALRMNLFERLSGARLYEELMLAFEESDPLEVIKKLSAYRLLGVIHPALSPKGELFSALQAVHDTLLWFRLSFIGERPDIGTLYLMGLMSALKDEDRNEAVSRLSVPPKKAGSVISGSAKARAALRLLPLGDPEAIYDALSPLPLEALLFSMALADKEEVKKEISHFLLELRKAGTILKGDDLKRMGVPPGPVYSEILKGLLREKLRGRLKTKEEEEEFVRGSAP